MATSIAIDVSDVIDLGRQMQAAQPVVLAEYRVAMIRSTAQVHHDAVENAYAGRDQGHLARSMTTSATPFEGRIGTNLIYAKPEEYGLPGALESYPGVNPHGASIQPVFPPAGALLDWMARHNIPAEAEFLIRRKIYRKGRKPKPFLEPALERNREAIDKEFALAAKRALDKITARRS